MRNLVIAALVCSMVSPVLADDRPPRLRTEDEH
jgi:hypothetical protein